MTRADSVFDLHILSSTEGGAGTRVLETGGHCGALEPCHPARDVLESTIHTGPGVESGTSGERASPTGTQGIPEESLPIPCRESGLSGIVAAALEANCRGRGLPLPKFSQLLSAMKHRKQPTQFYVSLDKCCL